MNLGEIGDYIILKIASLCHRKEERSFHTEDHQSIVCTRCSSQYIGFFATFVFLLVYGFYFAKISILYSVLLLVPVAVDGLTQAFQFRKSNNYLRILTGILFGSSFALLIGKSLQNNLSLLSRKVITLPSLNLLVGLGTLFLILSYFSKKTTPKNIYLIDGLVFIGYINMLAGLLVAILTTIINYGGSLIP